MSTTRRFVVVCMLLTFVVAITAMAQQGPTRAIPRSANLSEEGVPPTVSKAAPSPEPAAPGVFATINVPADYLTIQAAITAAAPGDVINVAAGSYIENIVVTKAVTIAGAGQASTFIYPALSGANPGGAGSLPPGSSNVFLVQADNVVIHDLTIDGDNTGLTSGIVAGGADLDARNGIITNHTLGIWNGLEVYNTTVSNIYLRGIYASSGGTLNLHDNIVTNVQADPASIAIFNFGGAGTISGNTVSYANDAIAANWSRGTRFLNNIVTNSGSGVHTDNNGGSGGIADTIRGNNVSNSLANGYGVWAFFPYLNVLIDNNTVTNCDVGLFAWGGAGGTASFTNNVVDGQGRPGSIGIYTTCGPDYWASYQSNVSVTFSGNSVSNTDYGFYVESDESAPFFSNTTTVSGHTASGNTLDILFFGLGPITTSGLTGNTLLVSNPGTIQDAIDAANPGGTVSVSAGTYAERVVVTKSLTLTGDGETTTILNGSGLAGNGSGIIVASGITNVTIEDLTVKNYAGNSPNSYAGIYAIGSNSGLTVQNVTLKDNVGGCGFYANGPLNGLLLDNLDVSGHPNTFGAARGIVVWNGLKENVTITNCDVYNNNCCGIELQDGSASGVTLSNNNIHDNGDNGIGVVGMQGPGENLISSNTVTNNGRFGIEVKNANGTGAVSGAGRIVVENNTVSRTVAIGAELRDIAGIAAFRRGLTGTNVDIPTGVVIRNNIVSGYVQPSTSDGFGIVAEGMNHSVTGNNVSGCDVGIQRQYGNLPYPGDGNQNNVADTYFGRGNSPISCGITLSGNTLSNTLNTRDVGSGIDAGIVTNTTTAETFCSINAAIGDAQTLAGHTLAAGAGTYSEDVNLTKSLSLIGAGAATTTILGPIGGAGTGVTVGASNATIAGFTITRAGNNPADWNLPTLNSAGIAIQGAAITGTMIRDNIIYGNRTGIDINLSSGHTIRNNVITDNRTGLIFRNQTNSITVVENEITNNWTVGVLFLDASVGTNSPVQEALNCTFSNNAISGNWYGNIVDRQSGGSLPVPGTNLKNFSGNWYGTNAPVVSTANSTEPGYAAQIPVAYGGGATPPGGQPDILGPASANFDYTPWLDVGTDLNVETVPGRGTFGFQGNFATLWAAAASAQTGATGRIQEGVNMVSGSTIKVLPGTYNEQVVVNRTATIVGVGGPQPVVNFTGTVSGRPALFDVTADGVTIDNLHLSVDLSKLRSAILASSAGLDVITIQNNLIDAYGTPAGSYGDRNAVSVNYGGSTNYRVATGGVNSVTFAGNTVTGSLPTSFFRSGISLDEGGGTFTGNTLATVNHDVLVRFGSNGNVTITGNNFNGGGVELDDMNAAAGVLTVSGNAFDGTMANVAAPGAALLRLQNNYNAKTTVVNSNTFTNLQWGVALANYNTVSLDGNTFTPVAGSTTFHHVAVGTKAISTNSASVTQVTIGAALTNNVFNGSGTPGGTALSFLNHDNDAASFGTFTMGTTGNENTFHAGIANFIAMDAQSGVSSGSAFPAYTSLIGAGAGALTTMAPWAIDLDARHNAYDVGTGVKTPSFMSIAERGLLENSLVHDPDNAALGLITYYDPLAAGGGILIGGFVNPTANEIFAGVDVSALDGVDGLDFVFPPPPAGDYLALYFRTDPGQPIENYSVDVKKDEASLVTDAKAWDLKALTDHTSSLVTLNFSDLDLPTGFHPTIYNVATGGYQDVRANPVLTYTSPASVTPYSFILLIGDSTDPAAAVTAPNGGEYLVVGAPYNITWTSSDASGVLKHYVYYSGTGAAPYTLLDSVGGSTHTYAWTPAAPAAVASIKVVARDSVLNETTDVSDASFTVLASSSVSVAALAGWNLVSVPMLQGTMTPAAVFGDDYGATPYYTFQFSPTLGYSIPTTLNMGQGYWLGSNSAQVIDAVGTPLSGATLPLLSGFNIIGNPFASALDRADVSFTDGFVTHDFAGAATAGWLSNVLYGYNGSGYYLESSTLGVWQGYWVPVLASGISVVYTPTVVTPSPATVPVVEAAGAESWGVELTAELSTGERDRIAAFGVRPDASEAFSPRYDAPRPPRGPADRYVEISIAGSDDAFRSLFGETAVYARKFMPADRAGWEVVVTASGPGEVTLRWDNSAIIELPSSAAVELFDAVTGTTVDMKAASSYTYRQEGAARRFSVNRPESAGVVPAAWELSQNYPNPFNPTTTITFGLPKAAAVSIEVYNFIGQRVAVLLSGDAVRPAGYHEITFDAAALASGFYYYTISAVAEDGSVFTDIRKMILLK